MAVSDRIDAHDPAAAERAATVLRAGGTVLLPTDTVYGLAALPTAAGATARLFALKGRAEDHPLAVLVADVEQARQLAAPEVELDPRILDRWPGALTVVVPRSPVASTLVLGGDARTVGIRCPNHDLVRAIARNVGPIATTSANRTGEPTASDADAAVASLLGPVDLVIDGGPVGTVASTVIDATVVPWRILRQGTVRFDELA